MSKIFVVSLHRCATQSTELFLRNAGFRTCHWPAVVDGVDYQAKILGIETSPKKIVRALRPVFEAYDAIDDVPLPTLYKELDKAYPGSRFIAVYRNPFEWVESVRRHCAGRPFDAFERVQYWHYLDAKPLAIESIADDVLIQLFLRHYRRLSTYFHGRDDFVLLDVGDPEIGDKLAGFLHVPPAEFPRLDYKDPTTHRPENTLKTLQLRLEEADIELAEERARGRHREAILQGELTAAETDLAATVRRIENFAAEQQAGWTAVEKGIEWRLADQRTTHLGEIDALRGEATASLAAAEARMAELTENLRTGERHYAELTRNIEAAQRWLIDALTALDPALVGDRQIVPVADGWPADEEHAAILARFAAAVQRANAIGAAFYEQAMQWRERARGNFPLATQAESELGARLEAAEAELAAALDRLAAQQRVHAEAEAVLARRAGYLRQAHEAELAALRARLGEAAAPQPGPAETPESTPAAPRVSIVLPVYNQAYLVEEAIAGVLSQTFENWQLIVVDDGSGDDLEDRIRGLAGDRRVLFLRQPNQKLPAALNHGFAHARGEYLTWTSADNVMLPTQLERLVAELDAHPDIGLVYSDYWAIGDDGRPLDDPVWRAHNRDPEIPDLIRLPDAVTVENFHRSADNFIGASFLYRRSVAEIVGDYADSTFGGEDYDFWLRMHLVTQFRHIPEPLYKYRVHADTLTRRAEELGLIANIHELLEADWWRLDTLLGDSTLLSGGSLLRPVDQFHPAIRKRCRPVAYSALSGHRPEPMRDGPLVVDIDVLPRYVEPAPLAHAALLLCRSALTAALLRREDWTHGKRILLWDGDITPAVQHAFIQAFADQVTAPVPEAVFAPRRPARIDDAFRPSRILLMTDLWAHGGLENVVTDLAESLAAEGRTVFVASARGTPPAKAAFADSRVQTIAFNEDEERFEDFLREQAIDIVNYHHSRFAAARAKAASVATIYTQHNSYLWMDEEARRRVAEGLAEMDRVIAVSRQAAQFGTSQFGYPAERIDVVPNGLPDRFIAEPARDDGGAFTVAMIASLTRPKMQHVAIAAFERAAVDFPEMRLRLIGAPVDPVYCDELRAQIAASPAAERIELIAGLSRPETVAALAAAHVFFLPSLVEGCSMALLEAAAAGCVCLATDVGSARELWVPGGPVLLMPSPLGELDNVTQQQFFDAAASSLPEHVGQFAEVLQTARRDYPTLGAGIPEMRARLRQIADMRRMTDAYLDTYTAAYRGAGPRRGDRVRSATVADLLTPA